MHGEAVPLDAPAEIRMAAARANLPKPGRAVALEFAREHGRRARAGEGAEGGSLSEAWAERRHLIVRFGPEGTLEAAVNRLLAAGVSAETPALVASGLGTARERLFYGSVEDIALPGFGPDAVVVVPHPAALPMDFAWPPTAAPEDPAGS